MDVLPTLWFAVLALLWIGFLLLEGFDFGVGMHLLFGTRDESRRRLKLNTIGPVWDGNEVWLLTAGAGTFAAFPMWYASLFSSLYVPLVAVLVALIVRAVSIEYRGKALTTRGRDAWTWCMGLGSLVAAFGIGAMLGITTTGLPLDEFGNRVGGAFAWFSIEGVIAGLGVVGFALVHGATFLALKTDGPTRESARRFITRFAPVVLLPLVAWVAIVTWNGSKVVAWVLVAVAASAGVFGWVSNQRGREGWSFIGFGTLLVAGASAIFYSVYPVVLPSTLDPEFSLTVSNASSSDYTLGVMSVVALVSVPFILAYQAWSYWVFRKRLTADAIPQVAVVVPAVRDVAADKS